jgi:hypothetical protein
VFEGVLGLGMDVVAGFEFPVVVPDAEAVGVEAFGEGVDGGLVFGAVAEEDVVFEIVRHVSFCKDRAPLRLRGGRKFTGRSGKGEG